MISHDYAKSPLMEGLEETASLKDDATEADDGEDAELNKKVDEVSENQDSSDKRDVADFDPKARK